MRISTRLIVLLVTAVVAVMAVYALVTVSRTQDRLNEELLKMAGEKAMEYGEEALVKGKTALEKRMQEGE